MPTLKFNKQSGCETRYSNPLGEETPEGEVLRVVKLTNQDGSIFGYEITYREGHFFMGGRKESVKELPVSITLED